MQNNSNEATEFLVEIMPKGSLEVLSRREVQRLQQTGAGSLHALLRRCALAVLNYGSTTDSALEMLSRHQNFDLRIVQQDHGVILALKNAPADAFVDGEIIDGIRELLFAVLRDIVFIHSQPAAGAEAADPGEQATNTIFEILRNAGALAYGEDPDMIVCWGGHAIGPDEYDYTKEVGYQLGLRSLNICTGCGPGAMKGPMKGATFGHSKQRIYKRRFLGLTEPGIIAAEPPNPIVNELVILPDMEKRLEGFVRVAHGIVVFPGGVGTLEELLYLLGILLHPDNAEIPIPLVLTGPESAVAYLNQIDRVIGATLGDEARAKYSIIVDNPVEVAQRMSAGVDEVKRSRLSRRDAYFFNWQLKVLADFQIPFEATHQNVAELEIARNLEPHLLAANLRRVFSAIVAGNIRDEGIQAIEEYGPFEIQGDRSIMQHVDALLTACVDDGRMRLPGKPYCPCYRII
jgi:predicted Rossmann-fold nucleotide-binding protein